MENFKFNLLVIIVFVILGGVIYWSVSGMNNDVYYTRDIQNENPVVAVVDDPVVEVEITDVEQVEEPTAPVENNTEYAGLITKIEKLVTDRVYMKKGSSGTRVGTVQEFLNIYHGTTKTVDNDYGPGTVTQVKGFQTGEGLAADGETGPNTYAKMIEWLKK